MMIKINDINTEYTKLVNKYINDGYIINYDDMCSVYDNEICHIDFVNSENKYKLIRIWMVKQRGSFNMFKQHNSFNSELRGTNTLTIAVKQYIIGQNYKTYLYFDDGITLYSKTFYEIDSSKQVFETDIDKVKAINKLRVKRYQQKPNEYTIAKHVDINKLPSRFVANIIKRIHQNYGCKSAKPDSIKEVMIHKNSRCKFNARVMWEFKSRSGSIVLQ